MSTTQVFEPGGYRYVPGVFQYSAGVAAQPGFAIERAVFHRPVPLAAGFEAIAAHLRALGRPPVALCACELRSPAPFSEEGFAAFNRAYVEPLRAWGIVIGDVNPVARTNVCPEVDPPAQPAFHAFSYTVAAPAGARAGFVVAGSGEAPEGRGNYRDHVIRPGDTSTAGLREKAAWVLGEMERRMAALGGGWADASATQVYTVHDVHPLMRDALCARGAAAAGIAWHFARPPVAGLDYEMDVRGVGTERRIG
ncbi:MAG: hypothetical protein U1E86_10875 [Burkholderiaceae bacterium]